MEPAGAVADVAPQPEEEEEEAEEVHVFHGCSAHCYFAAEPGALAVTAYYNRSHYIWRFRKVAVFFFLTPLLLGDRARAPRPRRRARPALGAAPRADARRGPPLRRRGRTHF